MPNSQLIRYQILIYDCFQVEQERTTSSFLFSCAPHQINLIIHLPPFTLISLFINLPPFLLGKEIKLERGNKMHEEYKCWKYLHIGDLSICYANLGILDLKSIF